MSEWKVGDVAMVTAVNRRTPYRAFLGKDHIWWESGSEHSGLHQPETIRPLVVIDPEDAEQVERLTALVHKASRYEPGIRNPLQAALREFARPTPLIEEPQGLGAVVEDDKGNRWVRVNDGTHRWRGERHGSQYRWSDFEPRHILSHGVEAES